jgi:hypothetical protein
MKRELTGADYKYSVQIGSLLGFFVGWAIGVVLLLYLGSKELNNWPWVASIPLWNGLGWSTYGFIIGGGGVFADVGRKRTGEPEKESELKPAA